MAHAQREAPVKALARVAGFFYLLIIAGAIFAPFAAAPSGMMATPLAPERILAAREMYVIGGVIQLVLGVCDLVIAAVFFVLFRPVSGAIALAATVLKVTFVAIVNANVLNHFAPLFILGDHTAFDYDQRMSLALLFLRLRTMGLDISFVFFGFACLGYGYLILRSTFLPRIIGVLLAIGGLGYVANIAAAFLPPAIAHLAFPYVMLPAGFAEISLALWLTIVGVNAAKWKALVQG